MRNEGGSWIPEAARPQARDPLAGVRAGYDRWAAVYDHDANPLPALEEPHVRAALGEVAGRDVLDLGCGTGRHSAWLAEAGARVTALDFSAGMLDVARRKVPAGRVRFLAHDLHEPLPLDDASFDAVVSGLVLEHLRDLPGFFAEVRRVLRPGGRAALSAMHPAMFLRGSQARFTDPETGEVSAPGSLPHRISDFVMAGLGAGFVMEDLGEHAPDAGFVRRYPRAERYLDWPMLVVLVLRAGTPRTGRELLSPSVAPGQEGGCQCGAIRYRLLRAPLALYACHCRDCQKQSASAFGMSLCVARDAVRFRGAEPRVYRTRGGSGAVKHCAFCGACGTRLYHAGDDERAPLSLKAGSLDDTSGLAPAGHLWTKHAQPWTAPIRAGVRVYDAEPEGGAALPARRRPGR